MPKHNPQKPAKSSKSPAKALRDSAIIAGSLAGKTNVAIAAEMGIDRETVAKVLNSDDMKRLTGEIDAMLANGIKDAVSVILKHAKKDYGAATDLLKNFNSMRTSLKLEHVGAGGAPLGNRSDEQVDDRIKVLLDQITKEKKP